ncbi:hypothetical protein [Pseudoduganella violaceinigra]|uniref:hypothetical protein n=1 Tax=Pseudoduganella violaceinigra TaxID=246602 RepID=UPI0004805689|nr:hypothetical protein [Pseudoduganella violaceinigra]
MRTLLSIAALAVCVGAQAAPLPCQPQDKIDAAAIKAPIVLVGELHGTQEIPAFVAGLSCSLLRSGRPVVIGLEQLASIQPELDSFMASDGGAEARRQLAASDLGTLRDGRGSMAMLELVESARAMAKAGAPLKIFAFDPDVDFETWRADPNRAQQMRDSGMAANIMAMHKAHPGAVMVNLMGTTHAARKRGEVFDTFEPAAYLVSQQVPTFAISIAEQGGETWNCIGVRGKPDCAPHALSNTPLDQQGRQGEDVLVALGATKASPPIRQGGAQ